MCKRFVARSETIAGQFLIKTNANTFYSLNAFHSRSMQSTTTLGTLLPHGVNDTEAEKANGGEEREEITSGGTILNSKRNPPPAPLAAQDMLLGGEGVATTAEADVKNPLLKGGAGGAGRRSAEKKKQRMVQMAQAKEAKKPSSDRETKQEVEGEAPPVAEEKNNDEDASAKPPAFPPPMAPSPAPTSPAILPPTGLPSLRTMQARRKSSLPPIEALKGDLV